MDYRNFPYVGPNGYSLQVDRTIWQGCKLGPSLPYGLLIARVGDDPKSHIIGSEAAFTADRDGVLAFRIHDGDACLGDNEGTVTVTVTLAQANQQQKAQPVPSTPVPKPVPTPPPSISNKVRSIEEVDFANFIFTLSAPEEDCSGLERNTVPLRKGEFKDTSREYGVVVGLGKVVYADLMGEKSNQAIVQIDCTYGNHSDTVALVYALRNGEPVLLRSFGNGNTERDYRKYYPDGFIFPEGGASVEKGKLVFYRSADGSHACPKNRVSFVYTWNGKDFVLSGKPVKRPLKTC